MVGEGGGSGGVPFIILHLLVFDVFTPYLGAVSVEP